MSWSSQSQSQVTKTVESHRGIVSQDRVNVESHEIPRLYMAFFVLWKAPNILQNGADNLENGVLYAMKWRPIVKNGAQCCFNNFDCRLFRSKFSQFAFYLSLLLSVISESLAQPCCKCCNLSASVLLNVQLTTNGMCVKTNTHIYVTRRSRNTMSTTCDLYCCLLPQCEALCTCLLRLSNHNKLVLSALTSMWMWFQVQPSQKGHAICALHCNKEGMLLQPVGWCCIESVIHHKRVVHKEQHTNICDANKQKQNDLVGWSLFLFAATVGSFAHLPLELFDPIQEIYFLPFCMPNTSKWPDMTLYLDLDLHLATFQYIDGFGCYHFCLNRFVLEFMIFFWTSL